MSIDLGVTGAKREADTDLLQIMREVKAANPDSTPSTLVKLWRDQLDSIHIEAAVFYAGYNILRRATMVKEENKEKEEKPEINRQAIQTKIESKVRLWHWKVPGIGKTLPECTFGELQEHAALTGRFLSRLSYNGAPGTFVKEVFKTEDELQAFWKSCQPSS